MGSILLYDIITSDRASFMFERGLLARGSLPPGQASLIDGHFARLEVGQCKAGAGVFARVLFLAAVP